MKSPKTFRHELKRRGYYHRVTSDDRGRLDMVVLRIGSTRVPPKKFLRGNIVSNPKADSRSGHVLVFEMLGDRSAFLDVCGVLVWIWIGKDGVARISGSEDARPKASRGGAFMRDPKLDEPRAQKRRKGKR